MKIDVRPLKYINEIRNNPLIDFIRPFIAFVHPFIDFIRPIFECGDLSLQLVQL